MSASLRGERWQVTRRARWDPMSVASVRDFRRSRREEVEPRTLWMSGEELWTPYCLDSPAQVALVGYDRGADLCAAPFYYQAQFRHAQSLLLVGEEAFVRLGEAVSTRSFTPVMIHSTGRAGTTLVSKMFARLASCVSLSEPDLHTSLLERHGDDHPRGAELLRAGAQLYFAAHAAENATHLVLKFRGMCVELVDVLRRAHDDVIDFFLYRDAEAYVASSMAAFGYFPSPLWGLKMLHQLVVTRPITALLFALRTSRAVMTRFFPLTEAYTARELARLRPAGLVALSWLSMMHRAASVARPLPSLRYESMMRDPRAALEKLLALCRLPHADIDRALEALDHDSQRGSVVGKERTKRYELTRADKDAIHAVLARHPAINRPDFELPHAIA